MTNVDHAQEFESLPALYQRWATELLPGGIPREHVASCMDCVMCESCEPGTHRNPDFFNPDSKCCTHFPDIPNYLVGRAIHADTPGSEVLRNFVDAGSSPRVAVSLLAVQPSPAVSAHYMHNPETNFGRNADLLCPYAIQAKTAEGPLCGIWQHRNAVCSTYFCKHVRGETGHRFWQSIRNLFIEMEEALSWWCIAQLIPDAGRKVLDAPARDLKHMAISLKPDAWQYWSGTRSDFYEACAALVEALSWEESVALAGTRARLHTDQLLLRYEELISSAFPAHLRVAPYGMLFSDDASTTLENTINCERLQVPTRLLSLLPYFDGRVLSEVPCDN